MSSPFTDRIISPILTPSFSALDSADTCSSMEINKPLFITMKTNVRKMKKIWFYLWMDNQYFFDDKTTINIILPRYLLFTDKV